MTRNLQVGSRAFDATFRVLSRYIDIIVTLAKSAVTHSIITLQTHRLPIANTRRSPSLSFFGRRSDEMAGIGIKRIQISLRILNVPFEYQTTVLLIHLPGTDGL